MKNIKDMSMQELGSYVCSSLEKQGIKTVLSGGSCVEIYSDGKYTTDDIDLVDRYNIGHKKIKSVMLDLGFKEHNRYFVHSDTKWWIEFPRGPLGIGASAVKEIASKESEVGILRMLTPTDCVKDRLAAYYYWDDLQSLEQAVWVAKKNDCNLEAVKSWSESEGELEAYQDFLKKLEKKI